MVTQEYHKWPFTAATNIAIGDVDSEARQDRIEAAAGRAVAHDMINELPHGYETLLDRTFARGQDLSGGQWQRITAARGFLRDAELLIMDEPSSALDPRAEDALFQAIRDRKGAPPRSSSRTGSPTSDTPTGSSSCTTAGWSSPAHTPTSSPPAAGTPNCSPSRPPATTRT